MIPKELDSTQAERQECAERNSIPKAKPQAFQHLSFSAPKCLLRKAPGKKGKTAVKTLTILIYCQGVVYAKENTETAGSYKTKLRLVKVAALLACRSILENPNKREMNTAFDSSSVGGSEGYVKKNKRYWRLELQDRFSVAAQTMEDC
ncbi:hypothetical protein EK904_006488 [Melospiza melodia maxima]|nr:hypothetical protein EK904_006488 [Melospiza melodia maxima]